MRIAEINDKNKWEKFLAENSPHSLFSSWSWGEVSSRIYSREKADFKRLAFIDRDLEGIFQVQKIHARRGSFLHIRHGPVLKTWKKEYFELLQAYLIERARELGAVFIRISPLIENSPENRLIIESAGFTASPVHRMDGEVCWVLDLSADEDRLLAGMRKTTRYLIKNAAKAGVVIQKSADKKNLESFQKLYNLTAQRQGFIRHRGIEEEFEQFAKDGQIMIFEGFFQNILLSSAMILFYNHQAIYHHSASIPSKAPVNYLLQWEVIKEAKRRGKSVYNFWGIAPDGLDRHPWKNLTLFKKGFGGEQVNYLHAHDYPVSKLGYRFNYLVEYFRKIYKGY